MQTDSRVSQIFRSALAWAGDWTTRQRGLSSDEWDTRIWEGSGTDSFTDGFVLAHQGDGFEVHQMRWDPEDARKIFGRDVLKEIKEQYPGIDQKMAKKSIFTFIFAWGDPDDMELKNIMDIPISDGYLAIVSVLSDTDRLLPVMIHWSGAQVSDLRKRVSQALLWLQNTVISPKVPSPVLSDLTMDYIEKVRSGDIGSREKTEAVSHFISLDRSSFLELCDRLWPWIQDPNGQAAWLDKDTRFADCLWSILGDMPDLERPGVLRLAPWKTGLGQPRGLKSIVSQNVRENRGSSHVVVYERTAFGPFRVSS